MKYIVKQGWNNYGTFTNKKIAIKLAKAIRPGRQEPAAHIEVYCGDVYVCKLNKNGEVVQEVH